MRLQSLSPDSCDKYLVYFLIANYYLPLYLWDIFDCMLYYVVCMYGIICTWIICSCGQPQGSAHAKVGAHSVE